jgi:hypothetical protein
MLIGVISDTSGPLVAPAALGSGSWLTRARGVLADLLLATAVIWALPLMLAVLAGIVELIKRAL